MSPELDSISVREAGQTVLTGALLDLERRLDAAFVRMAHGWGAAEYSFPPMISAEHLHRLAYFQSFPNLATFPVALDPDVENLETFAGACDPSVAGEVELTATAPVCHVLTPAACYHVYGEFEQRVFEAPNYVTLRGTCFRREQSYAPLERQWSFSMREIVCIGTADEVRSFLEEATARVTGFVDSLGLDTEWEVATDPFFKPLGNPKFLYQKLEPVKHELVFDDRLAIGSTNFHRDYFGSAFGIQRDGEAASSGCIAFGLERWLHAFLATFGDRPADWPELPSLEACTDE